MHCYVSNTVSFRCFLIQEAKCACNTLTLKEARLRAASNPATGARATGVNTTDVELYGESYAGCVWADLTHFSLYGLAALPGNRPPDVSNAYPSIEYLWPPNHKFVDVTIEGVTDPDGDEVTISILSITSDEPTAKHAPDAHGAGSDIVSLRAERSGTGNGRVYVITFVANDGKMEKLSAP